MSTVGLDAANWRVIYPDGRYFTDQEIQWSEMSVRRQYGQETLDILPDPASEIGARVGGRWHTLKAPFDEDVHFFRFYRGRQKLGSDGPPQMLYHAIGYIWRGGKITLEIDQQGATTLRNDPLD